MSFDILRRWLMAQGLDVAFVRNDGHRRQDPDQGRRTRASLVGVGVDVRARVTWAYDQLGVLPPSVEPRHRARDADGQYMQRLIDNGYAYDVDGTCT